MQVLLPWDHTELCCGRSQICLCLWLPLSTHFGEVSAVPSSPGPTHLSILLAPNCPPSTPHSPPRPPSSLSSLPCEHRPPRPRCKASSCLKPSRLFLPEPASFLHYALLSTRTSSWCSLDSEQSPMDVLCPPLVSGLLPA